MLVEQLYTKCLAQGAYYIESNGEAAIIDPLREVEGYIQMADESQAKIKYIFETHFHADFVSGHVTLAEKTGATIVYGPNAETNFKSHTAKDGEEFRLGDLTIKVLHTPGHTIESSCFLLKDQNGKDHALFTGDTLFLGDVGRPDLAQKAANMTQEELAELLFDSLRNSIMPLHDDLIIYPGHGAGSSCGKSMMKETVDTLGNQKKVNYALRNDMTKKEFVQELTDGLLPPPGYFPLNVQLNKSGYSSIDLVLEQGLSPLSPKEIQHLISKENALVLDVRKPIEFANGHIPESIFVGLDGGFAPWVGEILIDVTQPIILVTPQGREDEAITRLARVGFDHVLGFLGGGIESWQKADQPIAKIHSVSANEMMNNFSEENHQVFDVRKQSEFDGGHIQNAQLTPLSELKLHLSKFPKNNFYLHCAGGYRSMIASSILKRNGINTMIDVQGGFDAIKETTIPLGK